MEKQDDENKCIVTGDKRKDYNVINSVLEQEIIMLSKEELFLIH